MDFLKAHSLTGWRSLFLWSLAFAGAAFGFLSLPSIGMLVAPFAFTFVLIVAVWARSWPEAPFGGFLIGPGVICLLIAFLHRDDVPCPEGGAIGHGSASDPGGSFFSCGGLDPAPWLIAGLILVAVGAATYFLFKAGRSKLRVDDELGAPAQPH